MASKIILMGDIIGSRRYPQSELHQAFNTCINAANQTYKNELLSPLTITLGDEFQGIVSGLEHAFRIIFYIDEFSRNQSSNYEIRYSLHLGKIETNIVSEAAHNMMGEGLSTARELLGEMSRRARERFRISVGSVRIQRCFENMLGIYDKIITSWNLEKDREIIHVLLQEPNDAKAGELLGKTRQQIWKRRSTLMINEYNKAKETILIMAGLFLDTIYSDIPT